MQAEVHARIRADPAFEQFKAAAAQVLRAGMRLVLNPMHKKRVTLRTSNPSGRPRPCTGCFTRMCPNMLRE